MEDEETHGLPQGGGDALHTRRTTPIVRGDEGSASTRGAKTSATAPNTLKSNGTTEMTNASVEESTSTKGASGTADATNPKNSVSDYVDALTTLALMPRAGAGLSRDNNDGDGEEREPEPPSTSLQLARDSIQLRQMEMALDDILCAALDIRSSPVDIVTVIPPHLAMEAILGRLEAAQLARCMSVSKAWRDRARGAMARLRALPPGQSRHLRRAAPRVADRVLRFFAAHCTSLRDVTVVGCCPSPASLRELVRSSRGCLRRLELCVESGAVDPYSYDPSSPSTSTSASGLDLGAGGGGGGSGGGVSLPSLLGGVFVDGSLWGCDREGIRSILAASGGGVRTLSLEMAAGACASAARCVATCCPALTALRLSANTLGDDDYDDDDDGDAEEYAIFHQPPQGNLIPPQQPRGRVTHPNVVHMSKLLGHDGADRPEPPSAEDIIDMVNGRLDILSKLFPQSLANTLVVLDLVYVRVSVDAPNLAATFPSLTHLRVVGYQCTTGSLLALVRRCPNLRALCLPYTRVTDEVCVAAAGCCPLLEVLDVAEPERGPPTTRRLALGGEDKEPITDATLEAFARAAVEAAAAAAAAAGVGVGGGVIVGVGVGVGGGSDGGAAGGSGGTPRGLRRLRHGYKIYGTGVRGYHHHHYESDPPSLVDIDSVFDDDDNDDDEGMEQEEEEKEEAMFFNAQAQAHAAAAAAAAAAAVGAGAGAGAGAGGDGVNEHGHGHGQGHGQEWPNVTQLALAEFTQAGFTAVGLAAFARWVPDCELVEYSLEVEQGHQWGMQFEKEAEKAAAAAAGSAR